MSWFSEMAGKAESFLNNLDQVAATAANKIVPPSKSMEDNQDLTSSTGSTATLQPSLVTHQPKYSATSTSTATKPVSHSRTSSLSSSFSTVSARDVQGDNYSSSHNLYGVHNPHPTSSMASFSSDDKIFEYLNSTDDGSSVTPTTKLMPPRKMSDDDTSNASIEVVSNTSGTQSGKVTPVSPPSEDLVDQQQEQVVEQEVKPSKQESRNVDKSQLIRMADEINSLTNEISRLNSRCIELETSKKRLNKRMENWKQQLQSSDVAIREANEREAIIKSLLAEKDGIISSLEGQLSNLNRDRLEILNKIDSLEKERRLLMDEREASVEETIKINSNYKETISKLNEELIKEKEDNNRVQSELMGRIQSLEEDQNQLINDLTAIKNENKSEKSTKKELTRKINQLESSLSELKIEYDNYKEKAMKTLVSKDELINQLQRGSNEMGDEGIADTNDYQLEGCDNKTLVLQHEVDTLKVEVKELTEKLNNLNEVYESKCLQLDSLEAKNNELNERVSLINEELINEKRSKEAISQDYQQLSEEFKYVKDEGKKLREGLNQRLADKEVEIDKLRKQLTSKQQSTVVNTSGPTSSSTNSVVDLQERIKNLTENLIVKQQMVEQLNSDRNSLTLQLERCESRLRNYQDNNSSGSVSIGMIHSSSASNLVNRYKPLMEESVQDGQVTRRVKRAYSQLDQFSIRLGQTLRIYPGARIAVIFYVIILHLWVFFLLFTYEPEVHNGHGSL